MDWNLKAPLQWEWENPAMFSLKEREITKFTTQAEDGGVISNGSMYSSNSGTCSGSELGNGSSRSSLAASAGSSSKLGVNISELNFEAVEGLHQNWNKNEELRWESPIGLKLGKRTYFEDFSAANVKPSSSPDSDTGKKPRSSIHAGQNVYCQVEGCDIDLIGAKDYHRKHRVCENHSKSPKVIIAGQERRFCQQCSRFHDLSEFDQKKRSCRKRLSEHNSRRRKPQPETLSFGTPAISSSFCANGHQMNYFMNGAPVSDLRHSSNSFWEKSPGFSLSTSEESSWPKSSKSGGDGVLQTPFMDFSDSFYSSNHVFNRSMLYKGTTPEVLNQGTQDLRRALSLLSNDSSRSPMQASNPLSECFPDEEHLAFNFHANRNQFPELHFSKAPFETPLFESNQLFSKSDSHFFKA